MATQEARRPVLTFVGHITNTVYVLIVLPPTALYLLTICVLTLPYTFYFWSSNFGIRKRDTSILQYYLDHFETLNPELVSALQSTFERQDFSLVERPSLFWPAHTVTSDEEKSSSKVVSVNNDRFTVAAGLFMQLEKAGFSRNNLMMFLMDHVESEVKIEPEEKAEYRQAMHRLCGHRTSVLIDKLVPFLTQKHLTNGEGLMTPGKTASGLIPYFMRNDHRMDWVIQKNAVLVPMDWQTHAKAVKMVEFGLWQPVKEDLDLETATYDGYWQLVDLR